MEFINCDNITEMSLQVKDVINGNCNNTEALAFYKTISYYAEGKDNGNKIDFLLISRKHGVIIFKIADTVDISRNSFLEMSRDELLESMQHINAKLLKVGALCKGFSQLGIPLNGILFTNAKTAISNGCQDVLKIADTSIALDSIVKSFELKNELETQKYYDIVSQIDNSRVLLRKKERKPNTKGCLAQEIESNIAVFGKEQREAVYLPTDGFTILRGLAGSGKTVLLAYKAAILHKENPSARIVFTFYTKSLYQNVQLLIKKFYRSLTDGEPDWTKITVMHAWGGQNSHGVYYDACIKNDVPVMTYANAKYQSFLKNPFETVCQNFIDKCPVPKKNYDYVIIDEGQDFPPQFIKICSLLTNNSNVIWAYDDLQTIFQENNPSSQAEKIGVFVSGNKALNVCYRNPNEILICAHAIGFGIYGEIVQMFDSKVEWEQLGYYLDGKLEAGCEVKLSRTNQRNLWKTPPAIDEIISAAVFADIDAEVSNLISSIKRDISDGLRPDDILVISVDDRNARIYLEQVQDELIRENIGVNNIHKDTLGEYDFFEKESVTLSTVHKAKGNEAFMVYVLGINATFTNGSTDIKKRNMLYTAMTRAKGWLRLSGIGEEAKIVKREIDESIKNYPSLIFNYPSSSEMNLIKNNIKIAQISPVVLDELKELKQKIGNEAFFMLFNKD